jgi:hypothetical protein
VTQRLAKAESMSVRLTRLTVSPVLVAPSCPKLSEESNAELSCNFTGINRVAKDAPSAQLDGASAPAAEGQSVQNRVHAGRKCFRIRVSSAPVAQLDRASAF